MARRCYQCPEDGFESLDEIKERRNAEIRAWGKQKLAEADAALLRDTVPPAASDWEVLDTPAKAAEEPVSEPEPVIEEKTAGKSTAKKTATSKEEDVTQ